MKDCFNMKNFDWKQLLTSAGMGTICLVSAFFVPAAGIAAHQAGAPILSAFGGLVASVLLSLALFAACGSALYAAIGEGVPGIEFARWACLGWMCGLIVTATLGISASAGALLVADCTLLGIGIISYRVLLGPPLIEAPDLSSTPAGA